MITANGFSILFSLKTRKEERKKRSIINLYYNIKGKKMIITTTITIN